MFQRVVNAGKPNFFTRGREVLYELTEEGVVKGPVHDAQRGGLYKGGSSEQVRILLTTVSSVIAVSPSEMSVVLLRYILPSLPQTVLPG